jgi:hypothetical protein
MKNFRDYKGLMKGQTSLVVAQRASMIQIEAREAVMQAERDEMNKQAFTISVRLSPASVESDQWKNSKIWQKIPSSSDWIRSEPKIRDWLERTSTSDLFWLKGSLVLVSFLDSP